MNPKKAMRVQPLIAVNGVKASSRWYQRLLVRVPQPDFAVTGGYVVVIAGP